MKAARPSDVTPSPDSPCPPGKRKWRLTSIPNASNSAVLSAWDAYSSAPAVNNQINVGNAARRAALRGFAPSDSLK